MEIYTHTHTHTLTQWRYARNVRIHTDTSHQKGWGQIPYANPAITEMVVVKRIEKQVQQNTLIIQTLVINYNVVWKSMVKIPYQHTYRW